MKLSAIRPYSVGEMRRVGSKHDGGYVIPASFPEASVLISFGLGDDWAFEKQLLKDGSIKSFIFFDHTVSLRSLFRRLTSRMRLKNFALTAFLYRLKVLTLYFIDFKLKKFSHLHKEIGSIDDGQTRASLYEISKGISDDAFVLKIDIEGNEYKLINQIISLSHRIPLLIIEFHDTEARRELFDDALSKLSKYYVICHTHANNFEPLGGDGIPIAVEITFGRRDSYVSLEPISALPIPGLDAPSSEKRADYQLSFG